MLERYLASGELTFEKFEDVCTVSKILMENGYVVLLSREDALFVINWVWSESDCADRNDVVFISRGEYELQIYEFFKAHPELNLEEDEGSE